MGFPALTPNLRKGLIRDTRSGASGTVAAEQSETRGYMKDIYQILRVHERLTQKVDATRQKWYDEPSKENLDEFLKYRYKLEVVSNDLSDCYHELKKRITECLTKRF